MDSFHAHSAEETMEKLNSSPLGLSDEEAAVRLRRYGPNVLQSGKKGGAFRLFLAQFKDFMTILLICAAAVSAVIAYLTKDMHELADTGILLFIIFLNTFVGFIQQYRADNAIEKLKTLSVCRVKAIRGGKDVLLDSADIVPGDVIALEEGDRVPADCRILRAEELKCDESALTGESVGVSKTADVVAEKAGLSDRKKMLYSSSRRDKRKRSSYILRGSPRSAK